MPSTHVKTTVGDLLRVIDDRAHRFRQLQALEKAITGNPDVLGALTRQLEAGGFLKEGETVGRLVADFRSEEYARLASLKESVYATETGGILSVSVRTATGPVELVEPAFRSDRED